MAHVRLVPPRARGRLARRIASVGAVMLALAAVAGSGWVLDSQSETFEPLQIPLIGKSNTICTVSSGSAAGSTTISAVAVRQASGREGVLTGTPLPTDPSIDVKDLKPILTVTEQGKATMVAEQQSTIVLQGEGIMATASSGVVLSGTDSGEEAGLMAAPCAAPSTEHWFPGIGTETDYRSELILTNPDDAQAELDLDFFGPTGVVAVPGSPNVVVEAHSSRSISLAPLISDAGPISMSATATTGRFSAVLRDLRSENLKPTGADWQTAAVNPANQVVIPAIPDGGGDRRLIVVNPNTARAEVKIEVLGQQGAFPPVGAETLEVPGESTAAIDLAGGMAGQSGAVRLVSTQPVTGTVTSSSVREDANPDFSVGSATEPLVGAGVSAIATVDGASSELILSNSSATDTEVSFAVLNYDGVVLREDTVFVLANSTSTRRLTDQSPSYLRVDVPDGSAIVGGIVLTQPEGGSAGQSVVALTSPGSAGRAPAAEQDPTVGR